MTLTTQQKLLLHSARAWAKDIVVFVDGALENDTTDYVKENLGMVIKSGRSSIHRLTQVQSEVL